MRRLLAFERTSRRRNALSGSPRVGSQPYATFPPDMNWLRNFVASKFIVLDTYLDGAIPHFVIGAEPVKQKFRALVDELRGYGLIALIRKTEKGLVIRILPKPQMRPARRSINLILFLATIATITFTSYLTTYSTPTRLVEVLWGDSNLNYQVALFGLSIFGIIALHEFGHKIAAWFHGLDATLPYFIPGLPPFGTFGAVISLRSPPTNKDQLFDLGISGPIVGFLATIGVAVLSVFTAPVVSQDVVQGLFAEGLVQRILAPPRTPLLIVLILEFVPRSVPPGQTLIFTSILFAAQLGALITFLNVLPVWQLDGGHITRATFGRTGHKIATLVGFGILLLAGYYVFAIFIVLMMAGSRRAWTGVEPLDDVSPLSTSRRLAYLIVIAMFILSFVILPFT